MATVIRVRHGETRLAGLRREFDEELRLKEAARERKLHRRMARREKRFTLGELAAGR